MATSTRRLVSVLLLSLVAIALLVLLYLRTSIPSSPPPNPTTLTLATFSKALGNAPYHIARHFSWFSKAPELRDFRLQYGEFNDRPTISDAFDKHELQILFSGDAPAILCKAQGNDIRLVAVSGNANQEVLVPSASSVRSLRDLKGKRIAVLQATSSHYCLLKLLRQESLSPTDIQLTYMPPPEAKTAFETNQLDAWAVWAPWVEQQQVNKKGRVLPGSTALINSIVTAHSSVLDQYPNAVKALARVIEETKAWMLAHPQEAQRIAASDLGLDPAVVAVAWPKFNWAVRLDSTLLQDLQEKADFLASQDKTRQGKTLNVERDFLLPTVSKQ